MAGMKEVKWQVVCGVVCILWICLQIYLVVKYWDMPNHDDAYAYVQHASDCMAASTWYPALHNQYDLFVFGPGYVNLLIVVHSLFGSFSFVRLLNLILNIALVGEIWLLAKQLFGKTTAYWAALLYMRLSYTESVAKRPCRQFSCRVISSAMAWGRSCAGRRWRSLRATRPGR